MAVRVCGTVGETAALLGSVLHPEREAAELLAAAAHRDVAVGDAELDGVTVSIAPGDVAVWIDPIGEGAAGWAGTPPRHCAVTVRAVCVQIPPMSTSWGVRMLPPRMASRRRGCARRWCSSVPMSAAVVAPCWVSSMSLSTAATPRRVGTWGGGGGGEGGSHLAVATVGTSRGVPLRCPRPGRAAVAIGVSPPRRWQGRYHWGIAYQGTHLSSLSPPAPPRPPPRVVLSRAEAQGVRDALASLCGGHLRFAAGAGYKMLCVILGHADAYVLSGGSTFAWDACAPHAILCALGGGVVALGDALRARREGDTGTPPQLTYNRPAEGAVGAERWANRGGLVAYVHPQHLEAVLEVLAAVPGL